MNRRFATFNIVAFVLASLTQIGMWYVILFVPPQSPSLLYVFGSFATTVYAGSFTYIWTVWRKAK